MTHSLPQCHRYHRPASCKKARSVRAPAWILGFIAGVVALVGSVASAAGCTSAAIGELRRLSPSGYEIYARYNNPQKFRSWMRCDDVVGGLATAVHESVHMLTSRIDAYPLIGGGQIVRVPESPDFYPPRLIAPLFDRGNMYVQTYLMPGAASSADYFRYLLDEFNAYTHDLNTAVALNPLERTHIYSLHRDGLAALMAFTAAYVDEALKRRPRTWTALNEPRARATVVTLWNEAERVMAASCRFPRMAQTAGRHLSTFCAAPDDHGMAILTGRPFACDAACLDVPTTPDGSYALGVRTTTIESGRPRDLISPRDPRSEANAPTGEFPWPGTFR
ncbi:MAG: hypothetical protein ACFCUN_08940 [Hyphomicrobiaceae bacterium]